MNRRREKQERDDRIAAAELMALRAQTQARAAVTANAALSVENDALRLALIKKAVVTDAEIDAEKPVSFLPAVKP